MSFWGLRMQFPLFLFLQSGLGCLDPLTLKSIVFGEFRLVGALTRVVNEHEQLSNQTEVTSFQELVSIMNREVMLDYVHHERGMVNAFRLVRRRAVKWPEIVEQVRKVLMPVERAVLETTIEGTYSPKPEEYEHCIKSVLYLVDFYKFDINDVVLGIVDGDESDPWDSEEIFDIAMYLYKKEFFADCIPWLIKTLEANYETGGPLDNAELFRLLGGSMNRIGMTQKEVDQVKALWRKSEESVLKELVKLQSKFPSTFSNNETNQINPTFRGLCNVYFHNSEDTSGLKCYYRHVFLPYYRFGFEIRSLSPWIVIYHHVIPPSECTRVQDIAYDLMGMGPGIARSFPINNEELHPLQNSTFRLEKLTGLQLNRSRGYVTWWEHHWLGIGDYKKPSADIEVNSDNYSSQLATIMLFFENDSSANLVLPTYELSFPVEKGSALVWFHLRKSGKVHPNNHLGVCPIVNGNIWTASKRVFLMGQEFVRPCELDP